VLPYSNAHLEAVLKGEPILVIPPEIATAMLRGEQVYDIRYLTPAARMMKAQLASGILTTWKFMNDVAASQPEVYDNIDEDESVKIIAEVSGGPAEIIRSQDMIVQIRQARAQQQAADKKFQQQLETMKVASKFNNAGGLGQQPPGVESPSMQQPLQIA
jgi:type I site-specific restriction-modification system R (restriction) subunit